MVEGEIRAGSDGRLIPSRVQPDVDHRDIFVGEVGGFGALWLQVKGATHLDRTGHIVAEAHFPVTRIPESARPLYVVCLLDLQQHRQPRVGLGPPSRTSGRPYRYTPAAR